MNQSVGMLKKGVFNDLLSYEITIQRPSEEIVKKIQNLSGLLESNSVSTNWRSLEKKPELYIQRRGFRNDSFQSLPQSPSQSPSHSPSQSSPLNNFSPTNPSSLNYPTVSSPLKKSSSYDSIGSPHSKTSQTASSFTKYVSKYKNTEAQVKDTILNTIILSKLNKFSASTYDEIREFLYQILGTSNEVSSSEKENIENFVKEFMNMVFKKAASEEIFCPLYAKLLGEISKDFPIIIDEMNKLHENYLTIFEECDDESKIDYDTFVLKNREKKYRQGYSQFLSELTSLRILSSSKLITIYNKIIQQLLVQGKLENKTVLNDEYVDCLLRITKVLRHRKEEFFVEIRKNLLGPVNELIYGIQNSKEIYKSISIKTKFLLLNIQDYLKGI